MTCAVMSYDYKTMTAAQIREEVHKACSEMGVRHVYIGAMLSRIAKEGLYKEFGFESFEAYCSQELHFGERKGWYLVSVWDQFVDRGLVKIERIGELDWSKAAELTPLVKDGVIKTPEQADDWITRAMTMTVREVKNEVKIARGATGKKPVSAKEDDSTDDTDGESKDEGVEEGLEVFRVGLFEGQAENVHLALRNASRLTRSIKQGHLLDVVCTFFNAHHSDTSQSTIAGVCKQLEETFGVKLVAFDPKHKSVLFGKDTLAELAE